MLEGGIDLMFSTALKVLYREQQITAEEMQEGLEHIPDDFAETLCKEIGWELPITWRSKTLLLTPCAYGMEGEFWETM